MNSFVVDENNEQMSISAGFETWWNSAELGSPKK